MEHSTERQCIEFMRHVIDEMIQAQPKCEMPLSDNEVWGSDGAVSVD